MQYVRCGDGSDGDILIALSEVVRIERHYREEREDIIVTKGGNSYSVVGLNGGLKIEDALVNIGKDDQMDELTEAVWRIGNMI